MFDRIIINPDGWVTAGEHRWRCALGQNGISAHKREGDKATPAGTFHMLRVFYRADRLPTPPETSLPIDEIRSDMGWCDDPGHADYNQLINLPHPARHEKMWREDALYNVVVQLDHNTAPAQPGLGSAIFMHVAKPNYDGTEGCIALNYNDLSILLQSCNKATAVHIPAP